VYDLDYVTATVHLFSHRAINNYH